MKEGEVLLAIWGSSDAKKLQTEAQELLVLRKMEYVKEDEIFKYEIGACVVFL